MKVELNDITLAYSQNTKKVYLCVMDKLGMTAKYKRDITTDFHLMVSCVQTEKIYTREDMDSAKQKSYNEGVDNANKFYIKL